MISTLVSYKTVVGNLDTQLERVSSQPMVEREIEYYLQNIGNVKTVDEFVGDYRLFSFAMKAMGLEDMTYAKAFMKKVLEGGPGADSFAGKLVDRRYVEFADTFNFKDFGESATIFTKAQQGVVDNYIRQTLEEQAGDDNEGVRLALYFQRKADSISNFYEILADPALAQVVRTSLGLPDSIASADIDKQVEMLSERLDIETFGDPDKLDELLQRFAALWDVTNEATVSQEVANVSRLFGGSVQGISEDLMLQIAQLKR
ncbi:DUF1217 domain-containing protein [Oricola thermophila]|uniref:DUF1217 domain-containing protein n=1 Tax=Oricola thermophila TaxID=2742145 RepID=A0A6N1VFF5_9HYPH|nr:DUF1217 domain-containing protein [Oricola thermophila]QKV19651.1 DUF1217 domain-containing protein [Oricola thermophila]